MFCMLCSVTVSCLYDLFFNSMGRPMSKRCSNLSTCVLGKLSQELHKLQTYPRTNVGAGTPGKKRSAERVYREVTDLIWAALCPDPEIWVSVHVNFFLLVWLDFLIRPFYLYWQRQYTLMSFLMFNLSVSTWAALIEEQSPVLFE